MILSDDEIIGIKDYAELTGKLRLIAKDCHWQLLEDAASTIDELRRDAERLRDEFAMAAMQGVFASERHSDGTGDLLSCSIDWYADVASHAYQMADAMLKERCK